MRLHLLRDMIWRSIVRVRVVWLGRGWTQWSLRSFPTRAILWFYEIKYNTLLLRESMQYYVLHKKKRKKKEREERRKEKRLMWSDMCVSSCNCAWSTSGSWSWSAQGSCRSEWSHQPDTSALEIFSLWDLKQGQWDASPRKERPRIHFWGNDKRKYDRNTAKNDS